MERKYTLLKTHKLLCVSVLVSYREFLMLLFVATILLISSLRTSHGSMLE